MSDENKKIGEEQSEAAENTAAEASNEPEEIIENTVEESAAIDDTVAEVVEEAVSADAEEAAEGLNDNAETIAQSLQDAVADGVETAVKSNKKVGVIAGVIGGIVVVAAIIIFVIFGKNIFNPYLKDYVDVSGITIAEIADKSGMELEDFLAMYDLPEDMPETTHENAAFYHIPAGKYAEMSGVEFAELKEILGWDDSITEETTIGDAFDKTKVGMRVGEDQVEEFKKEYNLDESVTADTLWGEIRNIVDTKTKEMNEATPEPEVTEEAVETESDDAEATETAATEAPAE